MMIFTKPMTVPSWVLVIGIVAAYLCSMVAAGHGVAPVAFFLIFGWDHWFTPVLLGLIGIVFLIGGKLFKSPVFLCQFGIALICISWVIFLWNSDMSTTIIFSIPFLMSLFYWGRYSVKARHIG